MSQIFIHIYLFFQERKSMLWLFLSLFLLLGLGLASQLKLEEDISRVIPSDPKVQRLNTVFQNSKFSEKIIVNLSLADSTKESDPEALIDFGDSLYHSLHFELFPTYLKDITLRFDDDKMMEMYNVFYENLPLYLDKDDYAEIEKGLNREDIREKLKGNLKTLFSPAGMMFKKIILRDPLSITPMGLKKLESLQLDENFELHNGYIFSKDKSHLLLFMDAAHPPNETSANTIFVERLDFIIDSLAQVHPNIHAEYFGSVPVAVGNANQIKKDIQLTVTIAIICLLILISFFFRQASIFFLIILPIAFGGIASLAVLFLIRTQVSAIALGIGSILLGIALDFSFHLFTHYKNRPNTIEVLKDVSLPIVMSCLTTASAFLCLMFVRSEALFDLGLFAAVSIVGAALFALIILPHFFKKRKEVASDNILEKIADYEFDSNKILKLVIFAITIVCLFTFSKTGFDGDLNKMNFVSPKLQQAEDNLDALNNYKLKSVFLIANGKDLNEALEHTESKIDDVAKLKEKGIVKKTSGLSTVLLSHEKQKQKIKEWNDFWNQERKDSIIQMIKEEGKEMKFKEETFRNFFSHLDRSFTFMDTTSVNKIIELFAKDFITQKEDMTTVITTLKVKENDKAKIYSSIEDSDNLIVFDRSYLSTKFLDILQSDFNLLIWLSMFVVFFILLVSFGRIELSIISILPMVMAWIWTLGIMGILGLDFNIFNIIISTFIFGLGIDYSIFIMNGLIQNYRTGEKNLKSYKTSILLSGLTTIIGMGVLIFAQHPALRSIAALSIIGIISVVIISFTIQPNLFKWLVEKNGKRRKEPLLLKDVIISILTFLLFLGGCISLTLLIPILKILPFDKKKKKHFFSKRLQNFCQLINAVVPSIKKEIINPFGETFEKPAVIVCNHQSHIDLTALLMLHSKIIVLTNDWVWNNPFYGFIVKYADFYPVTEGHEKNISLMKEKMADGYSILVFPEGTRSPDCKIKRFKKGAFLLAQELKTDIVPVLLHGAGHTVNKGENYIKDGKVTIKILPRIKHGEYPYGESYQDMTKGVLKYMRNEFEELRVVAETPDYFRNKALKNYLYKGQRIYKEAKKELSENDNFNSINNLIPRKGKIIDIACGIGIRAYMLSFVSEKREIKAWDENEENVILANNNISKHDKINFFSGDINELFQDDFDVLVLDLNQLDSGNFDFNIIWENCRSKMNKDGFVLVQVPKDKSFDIPSGFVSERLKDSFVKMMKS